MKKFELARRAPGGLEDIWEFVSQDSLDAADRLREELYPSSSDYIAGMPTNQEFSVWAGKWRGVASDRVSSIHW